MSRGTSTEEVEEAVSRAIAEYFREIGRSRTTRRRGNGHALPAVADASGRSLPRRPRRRRRRAGRALTGHRLTMFHGVSDAEPHATYTFIWRGRMIAKRSTVPFHDPVGPVVMGAIMIVALITLIVLTAVSSAGAVN